MALVKVGTSINFGVSSVSESSASSAVTGYSCTTKRDVKELRDKSGTVISAALHRRMDDITIDFVGAPAAAHDCGTTDHDGAAYTGGSSADEIYVDEVTVNLSSTGPRTTSLKLTGYYAYA